jgi:hypothetical protein
MQSRWSKALAAISIALVLSISLVGCEPKPPSPSIESGTVEEGGGKIDLSGIEQNLDFHISNIESAINTGNNQLAGTLASSNCQTTVLLQAQLQEWVIKGHLSPGASHFCDE